MIIDCFTYYNEEELLELRINLLKNVVNQFIIIEGDMSYTGVPKPFTCIETLKKLGLDKENIRVLQVNLPKDGEIVPNSADITYLSRSFTTGKTNQYAATRERIIRNCLQNVLEEYSDDDVFFFSDCDEMINPDVVNYYANTALAHKNYVIKVPLITLEGRADLRSYSRSTELPNDCNNVMFVCTKQILKNCGPFNLRFKIESLYDEAFITENGEAVKECGWHFTWMGDANRKIKKLQSIIHHADYIPYATVPDLSSQEMVEFLKKHKVEEGSTNPWGDSSTCMKKYPIENLPKVIFTLPRVENFLLPKKFSKIDEEIPVIGTAVVNGIHWLERMIDSIDYPVGELFIVNNNGRGQITEQLEVISKKKHKFIKKITVTHMPSNIGCAGAWNLIIRSYIKSPYWIIISPDVALTPGFLEKMLEAASDEEVGIVNASSADHGHGSFECFLMKDWLVQSHGMFDENFYPAYLEDTDYIMRMIVKPTKRSYMTHPFLHGEKDYYVSGSQTWRTEPELKDKIDQARIKNELEYMTQKWGSGWMHLYPWKTPFNIPGLPVSITTFDLNFARRKHLGF